MSKITPNQYSFSQGELSPLMYGRTDLELYASGVKVMRNMIADSRGPAKWRNGMKSVISFVGTNARVETVRTGPNSFLNLIFLDLELKIIDDLNSPDVQTIVSPWTKDQIDDIQIVTMPDSETIYLLHPEVPVHKLAISSTQTDSQEFLSSGNFIVPAGVTQLSVCVNGGGGGGGGLSGGSGWVYGASGGGGSGTVKSIINVTPSETVAIVVGAGGARGTKSPLTDGIDGGDSTLTYSSGTVTSYGGEGGKKTNGFTVPDIAVGKSGGGNGGAAGAAGSMCSSTCDGDPTDGGAPVPFTPQSATGGGGGGGGFGDGSGWDGGIKQAGIGGGGIGSPAVLADGSTAGGDGKVVISWGSLSSISLIPVSFTGAPGWGGSNNPSAGTYFQGRLWFGGSPLDPAIFLGSKSASPEDFTIGTLADDALSLEIENAGEIEWMESTKNLLIGTTTGEHIVISDQGLIKPGDAEVIQQSAYGSASIQPTKIGDQVMYVSPDLRKIRAMNYEWQQNNWLSKDLTFPSEHITKSGIKDLTWSQHPDNLLWAVLGNGTLVCLTYERSNGIFGWHRHDTNGNVLSSSSGFNGSRSVLVLAVERTPGSIDIEYFNTSYKLDSWSETSTVTPYNQIYYVDGFSKLDGSTVQILIDDNTHPDRIVGAESSAGAGDGISGRVYLQQTGSRVIIGLQYICDLETLDVDGGSQTGSGLAHKKRRNKIYVKILNSGMPLINGQRPPTRNPSTPMGTAEPLISGDVEILNLDWDKSANVSVSQDLPLPLIVQSIFGELARNTF